MSKILSLLELSGPRTSLFAVFSLGLAVGVWSVILVYYLRSRGYY